MKQVFLVSSNSQLKKAYKHEFSDHESFNLVERDNAEEVISILGIVSDIDLIITDPKIGSEDTLQTLLNYIDQENLPIGIISLGQTPSVHERCLSLQDPSDTGALLGAITRLLPGTIEEKTSKRDRTFYPVSSSYFSELEDNACRLYQYKNDAYEIVCDLEEKFSYEGLLKKIGGAGRLVYVKSNDHANLMKSIINSLTGLDKDVENNLKAKLNVFSNLYAMVKKEVSHTGLNNTSVYMVETIVQDILEACLEIENSDQVKIQLLEVLGSSADFHFKTVYMNSVLASYVALKLIKHPTEYQIKLTYLSFFSDILLDGKDELMIRDSKLLDQMDFESNDKMRVLEHAYRACELIKDYRQSPPDIQKMVKLHHGDPEGKIIYPRYPESQNKLNLIYFLVEEYALRLLCGKSFEETVGILIDHFDSQEEQKIVKVLKNVI